MSDVTIAHDYFTQRGGAERVALDLSRAFGSAPIHTSFLDPAATHPAAGAHDIRVSPWNRVAALRHEPRRALPLLPLIFSRMRPHGDVLVASSSGWAHGIGGDFRQRIVYCHNPARWLYQAADYPLPGRLQQVRGLLSPLFAALRRWDHRQATRATTYVANSATVRDRIRRTYGRDAEVIHPPAPDLRDTPPEPVDGLDAGSYLLCVARLLPYKHVLEVAAAVEGRDDLRLVIVGDGPLRERLRRDFAHTAILLQGVSDAQLAWLYRHCAATISASHEDFGLTPIEGFQLGRPAILLRAGGFLETQLEGRTGVFFDQPSPASIRRAIDDFARTDFSSDDIRAHARTYDFDRFATRMRELVESS